MANNRLTEAEVKNNASEKSNFSAASKSSKNVKGGVMNGQGAAGYNKQ